MTMAQRKKTKKIVLTIVMLILALIYIYPVFLMVINSVKLSGKYHVADADGGGEGFGKGVHIDHFIGYIDALQSRDRLPA